MYKSVRYTFKNRKSVNYPFFYTFTANLITTGKKDLKHDNPIYLSHTLKLFCGV